MDILFNYLGIFTQSEVHTAEGRADAVVTTTTHIYIFEFKIDKSAKIAMTQLKERNYAAKYANITPAKKIVLVAVNFSTKTRLMEDWLFEE